MQNDLSSLNNYLFEQLERLNDDEELNKEENFEKEIKRARAITDVAGKVIKNAELVYKAVKLKEQELTDDIPSLLLPSGKK